MTLGSHGDAMIALPRHATVDGQPLPELVDEATLDRLVPAHARRRRRDRGAAEDRLAPTTRRARRSSRWCEAIANDTKRILPVCAWVTGQYGIDDVYVGVPARLGRRGVEEIVELDLNDDELTALRGAAEGIRAKCEDLAQALSAARRSLRSVARSSTAPGRRRAGRHRPRRGPSDRAPRSWRIDTAAPRRRTRPRSAMTAC